MISRATRFPRLRHQLAALVFALVALGVGSALPDAQTARKALTIDDYAKWRSITDQEISGDGQWVTYVLQSTNTTPADAKPVLHVVNLESGQDVSVPHATGGTFSPDSKW